MDSVEILAYLHSLHSLADLPGGAGKQDRLQDGAGGVSV